MPEIKNERPSDGELYAYFLEHLTDSTFGGVHPDAPPRDQDRSFLEQLGLLTFRDVGGVAFVEQAATAIFESCRRLNQLPRSDLFWENTNRRPTIYKVPEFCRRILGENPRDTLALWTLASLRTFRGANDFGQEHWTVLAANDDLDIAMPIFAALLTDLTAYRSAAQLSLFLKQTRTHKEAGLILGRLAQCGHSRIEGWSRRVTRAGRLIRAPD